MPASPSSSRHRSHSRDRTSRRRDDSRERHRDRERDYDRRDRDRERSREREKGRDRDRESHREREKNRDRPSHRGRSLSRSRSPSRRDRDRDASRSRRHRHRSRSRSSDSSGSSSDDDRRHHRRRHRSRSRSRSRDRDREERRRRRKEKKEKRRRKKEKRSGAIDAEWGKYGIIDETDMYNKDAEFRAWLVEERTINPEHLTKDQTKKQFARFVEDYNTATLPHEKYYALESYEKRMHAIRSGETLPDADGYDPAADLAAHSSALKRPTPKEEGVAHLNRTQLEALRKVQNERIEASKMKLLGQDVGKNFGVRMDGSMFDRR